MATGFPAMMAVPGAVPMSPSGTPVTPMTPVTFSPRQLLQHAVQGVHTPTAPGPRLAGVYRPGQVLPTPASFQQVPLGWPAGIVPAGAGAKVVVSPTQVASPASTPIKGGSIVQEAAPSPQPPSPKDSIRPEEPPGSARLQSPDRQFVSAPFDAMTSRAARASKSAPRKVVRGPKAEQEAPAPRTPKVQPKEDGTDEKAPPKDSPAEPSPRKEALSRERRSSTASSSYRNQRSVSPMSDSSEADSFLLSSLSMRALRTPRSPSTRSKLSLLSAASCESNEVEHRRLSSCLQREQRWLRRALSEEVRRVAEMKERQASQHAWRESIEKAEHEVQERRREKSLRRWEESCKQKLLEEERQRRQGSELSAAFERRRSQLEADRRAKEAKEAEQRDRQHQQADKRKQMLAALDEKRQAETRRLDDLRQRMAESQEARDRGVQAELTLRDQIILERRSSREERSASVAEAQKQIEMERQARHEAKAQQKAQQHGSFSARQSTERAKMQSLYATRGARRAEAQTASSHQQERRRSETELKVRQKSQKLESMQSERQQLWQLRKEAQSEARKILRSAKGEVERQAMSSRFSLQWLERQMARLEQPEALANSSVASGPLSPQSSRASLAGEASLL